MVCGLPPGEELPPCYSFPQPVHWLLASGKNLGHVSEQLSSEKQWSFGQMPFPLLFMKLLKIPQRGGVGLGL